MLGQVRLVVAVAVAACGSRRDEAASKPVEHVGPAHRVSAKPAADVPCKVGAACAIRIDLVALGPFHVNREYPFRFEPDPALAAELDEPAPAIAVRDDRNATYTVGFKPSRGGALKVTGTFKLSVCTDEECRIEDAPIAVDVAVDDGPATLDDLLPELRAAGFAAAADAIAARAAQTAPKMKLDPADAVAAARAVLAVAEREPFRALHGVMPRSTVELARAVAQRGVAIADADAIATYLIGVVAALDFERLDRFDDNHSHVTGREWHEIDYTGEAMTWQAQQAEWEPRGVTSFERAAYIHAYFTGAEKLPHWKRVYRPRGRIADVPPPNR